VVKYNDLLGVRYQLSLSITTGTRVPVPVLSLYHDVSIFDRQSRKTSRRTTHDRTDRQPKPVRVFFAIVPNFCTSVCNAYYRFHDEPSVHGGFFFFLVANMNYLHIQPGYIYIHISKIAIANAIIIFTIRNHKRIHHRNRNRNRNKQTSYNEVNGRKTAS
jgi:hypothetical protein